MSGSINFKNRNDLKKWMMSNDKSASSCYNINEIIKIRTCLRVLPMVGSCKGGGISNSLRQRIYINSFRHVFMHMNFIVNKDLYRTGNKDHHSLMSQINKSRENALKSAQLAKSYKKDSASYAIYTIIQCSSNDFTFLDTAILSADIESLLLAEISLDASIGSASVLMDTPIWSDISVIPNNIMGNWKVICEDTYNNNGFSSWIGWYETFLPKPNGIEISYNNMKGIYHKISSQSEEWWNRKISDVNDDIISWMNNDIDCDMINDNANLKFNQKAKAISKINNEYFGNRARSAIKSIQEHLRNGNESKNIGEEPLWVDAIEELNKIIARSKK